MDIFGYIWVYLGKKSHRLRPVVFSTRSTNSVSFRYTRLHLLRIPSGIYILPFKSFDLRIASEGGRSRTMLYSEPGFSFRAFSKISSLSNKLERRNITLFRPTGPAWSLWTAVNNMLSALSSANERTFFGSDWHLCFPRPFSPILFTFNYPNN